MGRSWEKGQTDGERFARFVKLVAGTGGSSRAAYLFEQVINPPMIDPDELPAPGSDLTTWRRARRQSRRALVATS